MKQIFIKTTRCKSLFFAVLFILSNATYGQGSMEPPWWEDLTPCAPPSSCNLINNANPLDDGGIYLSAINPNPIDNNICTEEINGQYVVHCWFPLCGTPGVPTNLPPGSLCPGTALPSQMVNEFSMGTASNGHVAMMGQLTNFIAGHKYNMYFKMRTGGLIDNFYVKLGNHTSVIFTNLESYGGWLEAEPTISPNQTIFTTSAINNPSYTYYCFSFIPDANYDMIYLYPKLNISTPEIAKMLYITDIHVFDITTAAFPQSNYVLNCNQNSIQMGNPDCTLPAGGTWSWTISPAATISGANTANPTFGPITNTSGAVATYTVTATYSLPGSVGGCSTTATQTLTVFPNPTTTSIVGLNAYCTQNTLDFTTLLGSCPGCTYSWFIGSGGSSIVNGTENLPTVSVNTDGSPFTLNVEIFDQNGCMYTATITVNNDCCVPGKDLVIINTSTPILLSSVIASITPPGINDIYIQGELVVDGNYTLFKKDITFGTGSKVTVQANKTLTISGTVGQPSHLHGCTTMWQGIYAELPSSKVVINNSIIEDAIVGTFVKNTGEVQANNSKFINNYISIRYENYTSPANYFIRGCLFRSQAPNSLPPGGGNPGYLLPPHSGEHSVTGIEIYNCPSIQIAPTGVPNLNKFEFMKNGIVNFNSNLFVSNATFQKIEHFEATTPALNDGIGIRCINQTNTIKKLQVDNTNGIVKFRVSDNGIIVDGTHQSQINNNEFVTIKYRAISHSNVSPIFVQPQVQLTVTANKIDNTFEGIFYYNCGKTISRTELNILKNLSPVKNSRAIIVEERTLGTNPKCDYPLSTILIKKNTSRGFSIGISTSNASCMNIYQNDIYLQSPNIYQHHGIWLNSSPLNTITTNNVYGNLQDWHCIGTRFYKSNNCVIGCNYIDKTDVALWIDNDCNFSQIVNNTFRKYNNAIFFVNSGKTGAQYISGLTPLTTSNSFDKTANSVFEFTADSSIAGSNSIFYFWNSPTITADKTITNINGALISNAGAVTSTSYTNPGNPPAGGLISSLNTFITLNKNATGIFTPNPGNSNGCGGSFISRQVQGFNTGEIANMGFTPFYQAEHTWMYKQNVLRSYELIKDSVNLDSLPTNVVNLLNDINTSNVKTLDSVEVLLGLGNWSAANGLNSSCNAYCNYSGKLKEINQLLIPQWDSIYTHFGYVVDTNLIQPIVDIANLCMVEYGDAVLKARIFLRNHVNPMMEFADVCETILPRNAPINISDDVTSPDILQYTLYPNPANNLVNIYANVDNEINYQVIDLQGRILATGVFTSNLQLNTLNLPDGIYFVGLINSALQKNNTVKFIIAH
jgi:hypothetical protein